MADLKAAPTKVLRGARCSPPADSAASVEAAATAIAMVNNDPRLWPVLNQATAGEGSVDWGAVLVVLRLAATRLPA